MWGKKRVASVHSATVKIEKPRRRESASTPAERSAASMKLTGRSDSKSASAEICHPVPTSRILPR